MRPVSKRRGALRQRGYRFGLEVRRFGTGASVPAGTTRTQPSPMAWIPGLKRWSVASTWGVAGNLLRFPLRTLPWGEG